jgi:hypothetical protein
MIKAVLKAIQEFLQGPKIGSTHLPAMGRQGLKELANILPAFPESIKPVEEVGLFGNALPQEVYKARHETEPHIEQNLEMQM